MTFSKNAVKTYLFRGLMAAAVYCIPVVVFLHQQRFESIWLLYLGNALYLFAVVAFIYVHNTKKNVAASSVNSAISGHVLSITGAAISVILSLLLYFLFYIGIDGKSGEVLQHAPATMSHTNSNGMLFVLLVNAALGNTISGFFAAVITSFTAKRNQTSEQKT